MKKFIKKFVTLFAVAVMSSFAFAEYSVKVSDFEVLNETTGNTIRGKLYAPETTEKIPAILTAHELGSNMSRRWPAYGEHLAQEGIAVFTFDFCGGGPKVRPDGAPGNTSDGETTQMSIASEVIDLEYVYDFAKKQSFIDSQKIGLIGGSQGGAVSIEFAGRHPESINALVLLYPAQYTLMRMIKGFEFPGNFPTRMLMWGTVELGHNYGTDAWELDFDKSARAYKKSVLILHGTKDNIVNIADSKRIAKKFKNAELKIVENGGHGFQGETFENAISYIDNYLKKCGFLK